MRFEIRRLGQDVVRIFSEPRPGFVTSVRPTANRRAGPAATGPTTVQGRPRPHTLSLSHSDLPAVLHPRLRCVPAVETLPALLVAASAGRQVGGGAPSLAVNILHTAAPSAGHCEGERKTWREDWSCRCRNNTQCTPAQNRPKTEGQVCQNCLQELPLD